MPRYQQFVRLWTLFRRLEAAPHGLTVSQLSDSDPASHRRFYRDIEALQEAGVPVYSEEHRGNTRWFVSDSFRRNRLVPVPSSEILALRWARQALGSADSRLRSALDGLIEKLDSGLTNAVRTFAASLDDAFAGDHFGPPPDDDGEHIETLSTGCAERWVVKLRYRSARDEVTERRVAPLKIWHHRGRRYLYAYCYLRKAIRTFSLTRIQDAKITDEHFEAAEEAVPTQKAYAESHFRIMDDGVVHDVAIWFAPEAELYVREQRWHKSQSITAADDGGVVLRMRASGLQELSSWVLSFGPRARAMAPKELVSLVRAELSAATAHY